MTLIHVLTAYYAALFTFDFANLTNPFWWTTIWGHVMIVGTVGTAFFGRMEGFATRRNWPRVVTFSVGAGDFCETFLCVNVREYFRPKFDPNMTPERRGGDSGTK